MRWKFWRHVRGFSTQKHHRPPPFPSVNHDDRLLPLWRISIGHYAAGRNPVNQPKRYDRLTAEAPLTSHAFTLQHATTIPRLVWQPRRASPCSARTPHPQVSAAAAATQAARRVSSAASETRTGRLRMRSCIIWSAVLHVHFASCITRRGKKSVAAAALRAPPDPRTFPTPCHSSSPAWRRSTCCRPDLQRQCYALLSRTAVKRKIEAYHLVCALVTAHA